MYMCIYKCLTECGARDNKKGYGAAGRARLAQRNYKGHGVGWLWPWPARPSRGHLFFSLN